jgi:SAM-dependent methyltransferase
MEPKPGQQYDTIKGMVLAPALLECFNRHYGGKQIDILDVGTGTTELLVHLLHWFGRNGIGTLGLVDIDEYAIARALRAFSDAPWNMFVMKDDAFMYGHPYTIPNERQKLQFDLALSNLMFHQVRSNEELSLIMMRVWESLQVGGHFMISDLNPAYIEELISKGRTDKFKVEERDLYGNACGMYHLSGGSVFVYNRSITRDIVTMLLCNGFTVSRPVFPNMELVYSDRPDLKAFDCDSIFYVLDVQKVDALRRHQSGVVNGITQFKKDGPMYVWLSGSIVPVKLPFPKGVSDIKIGEGAIYRVIKLHGTVNTRMHHFWWFPGDGEQRIRKVMWREGSE